MIWEIGGKRQLIIWHPEAVNGLDPKTGKVFWTIPWKVERRPHRADAAPGRRTVCS